MGDSDDDHDRPHNRDKFRRERNDYSGDKGRRSDSYRDRRPSWREDRRRPRDDDDDGRRRHSSGYGRNRDYSPPPHKRARKAEWESLRDFSGMIPPYGMPPHPWGIPPHGAHPPGPPMVPGIPREVLSGNPPSSSRHTMLSFKQFLAQQDDSIGEDDAITKYNEYKNEFRGTQMREFFEAHKAEEWFQSMYHPKQLEATKTAAASFLCSRVDAFMFLLEKDWFGQVSLNFENNTEIIRIMDAAVIKMEGGTEQDLAILDNKGQGQAKDKKMKKQASGSDEEISDGDLNEEGDKQGSNGVNGKEASSQEEQNESSARELHKTCSVYLRHLPPKISSEDIVEICKTVPGYLRIAFAEPSSEKNFERRGWATFSGDADIVAVMEKLTSTKVKECMLTCSVNRDLSRRIKQTSHVAWARKCMQADIGHALNLIDYFDKKSLLWDYTEGNNKKVNPVLAGNLPVLLEEEESAMAVGEDEEGAIVDNSLDVMQETSEKVKAFELLVWYLRIVHSCDFYSAATFASEDTMPHRCGIFTVRPHLPDNPITQADATTYCEEMVPKVESLVVKKKEVSDEDLERFGKKDPEAEAKQFVELNTQKLSENKYLCPLSGKKFKGPEFVRKHIFNKHQDKVEAVKKEATFYNNYMKDPDRPMSKEASVKTPILPPTPKTPGSEDAPVMLTPGIPGPGTPITWGQDQMMHMYGRGDGYGSFPRGERRGRGRRGRGRRNIVNYRDLDAPDEVY